ncbi:glycosyltransferase family 39 protein [Candidatus Roizmanbacteria bacterium]|nr:glycosyltransferase family 39 protein [Candidatus Roizmanbacteria bacterium]
MRKKFMILFGVAFLIRLIALNQSLWLDEAITAKVARQFSLFQISALFSPSDFHPPLFYIVMKMWTSIFGSSEAVLRMPSVIFSLLTGHAIFLIGTRLKNQKFGLWAAALYLFNPLVIYYSQEARMYSMVTYLLTFALYFWLEIMHHQEEKKQNSLLGVFSTFLKLFRTKPHDSPVLLLRIKNKAVLVILFNLLLVLSVWTFYGSVFFIAGLLLLFLLRKQYRQFIISSCVLSLSLIIQYPLLSTQMANAGVSLTQVPYWSLVLGTPSLKNLLLIPVKFSVGRISFYPKIFYYAVAGLWTLFTFSFVILGAIKRRFLFFIFLFPLLLAFLFSFFSPLMQYFRFLYLLPVMSLLIVAGVDQYISVKERKGFFSLFWKRHEEKLLDKIRNNAVFEILMVFFILFSLLYLLIPAHHREDWKRMSQILPANSPVYIILPSSDPLLYYRPDITLKELRTIGDNEFLSKDTYVVPYTSPIYGFDYENALRNKGCHFNKRYTFREIYFEKWNCGFISSS